MPGVPSNKACERCKKRHLKCDETRPQCQRCINAGVKCPGYIQTRKFIDQGAIVRRRYAPYQDNASRSASTAGRSTPDTAKDHQSEPEQTPGRTATPQTQIRPELGKLATNTQSQPETLPTFQGPSQITPVTPSHMGAVNSMLIQARTEVASDSAIGDVSKVTSQPEFTPRQLSPHAQLPSSRSLSQHSDKEEFQDIFSELMTGTEHEISFLIRHFTEVISAWLDLSDTGRFFKAYVPIRAINEPCLKYSIAALSAKHLGRMKGVKYESTSGMFTSPATTETYPNSLQVDWFLKAANYYYLAVSHMNPSASDAYAAVSTSAVLESPVGIVSQWLDLHLKKPDIMPQEGPTRDAFWKKTENLLAASAILTTYKLLDEPGENWQLHLTEVGPLFNHLLELITNTPGSSPTFSHGITAAFWIFARHDYLASYFNRLPTHFDSENLVLWRAAGLSINEQGAPCSPKEMAQSRITFSEEDLAANRLTRLLNKVSNFLAASKRCQLEQWTGGSGGAQSSSRSPSPSPTLSSTPSPRSYPTTSAWLKLSFEFQSWIESIPETFRPCLRLEQPKNLSKPTEMETLPFPEIFYSLTSCAAAMQHYHWGRLALSLNRPSDEVGGPSTAFDRLQGYRELTKEVDYRCREICGIALGRPQSGARIHMITLLFAVGQCLEKPEERQIIINLLRGIEADLGWATESHVQKLQKSWDDRL